MACTDANAGSLSFEKAWIRCVSDASTSAPCELDRDVDRASSSDGDEPEARIAEESMAESYISTMPKEAMWGQSSAVTTAIVLLAAMLGFGMTTCLNIPSQIAMPLVGLLLLELAVLGFKPSTLASGLSGFVLVPVYIFAWALFLALLTPPF